MPKEVHPAEMFYRIHRGTAPDASKIPHWDDLDPATRTAITDCVQMALTFAPPDTKRGQFPREILVT